MEEITVNEFNKKAEALITEWQSAEKVCPSCGHKYPSIARFCAFCGASLGLDLVKVVDPSTILSAFHYIPYILATIHYALEVSKKYKIYKAEKDIKEKVNLWLDESIDRILQFALNDNVDEEGCKNNMREVLETFIKEGDTKNMISISDIISNKMYNVLKKYYPDAGSKGRELIDYIVRAELVRLKE